MRKGLLFFLLGYGFIIFAHSVWTYNPMTLSWIGQRAGAHDWKLPKEPPLKETGVYYPPLYYLLVLPFTHLDTRQADILSYFSQFILFYFAILWLVKATSHERSPTGLDYGIAFLLALNFQPFRELCALHAVEGKEFFLICLAILAFKKKKDLWAGALLLVATNLKFLPGILIAYFLLKREYRVLWGVAAALLVMFLVLIPLCGIERLWAYAIQYPLHLMFSPTPESNFVYGNLEWETVSGTINRLFPDIQPPNTFVHYLRTGVFPTSQPHLAYRLAMAIKLPLIGVYLFFIRRRWHLSQREEKWKFHLLEISMSLVMLIVVVQAFRIHYGILLLPAFIIVGLMLHQNAKLFHLKEKIFFVLAFCLSGRIIPGALLNRLPPHPVWGQEHSLAYLWLSIPFYGYMLLGVSILVCYKRLLQPQTIAQKSLQE